MGFHCIRIHTGIEGFAKLEMAPNVIGFVPLLS
jgi:hypothetical protein